MFTPEKTARYENLVALAAQEVMQGRPPLAGAVELELTIETSPPVSWSKAKRVAALAGQIRPTVKPDCSNVLKGIEDAMNGIVYVDDAQIVQLSVRKIYSETIGAMIVVKAVAHD